MQYALAAIALFAPLTFDPVSLHQAQEVPALGIVFVSLVAVTGYSGQISLGQAGYAGLGALFFAKVSGDVPELVALLVGDPGGRASSASSPATRRSADGVCSSR